MTRPENPLSERACLAGLLMGIDIDAAGVREVADTLDAGAFADPVNREVMECILDALASDRPGTAAIQAAARRRATVAGNDHHDVIACIADLIAGYVGRDPVHHARLAAHEVRHAHGHRQALVTLQAGLEGIRGDRDASAVAGIIERLQAVQATLGDRGTEDMTTGIVDEGDAWARDESEVVIPTDFWPLDRLIDGGLPPGLTAIAGQPGAGKSAFAAQLMLGALLADRDLRAVWCRGEMRPKKLHGRLVAAWSSLRGDEVPHVTSRDARHRTSGARKVSMDMVNVIGNDRLRYVHSPLTVEKIAAAIARHKPRLVIVDHLGKIQGDGRRDRRVELEDIVQRLWEIADANDLAMIVTTPVSKTATEESDIGTITRDSNRLDFDAETYVSLWVNKHDRKKDPREVRMVLNKTRSGHEDSVPLMFTGSGQSFYSTEPEPQPFDEFADFAPGASR